MEAGALTCEDYFREWVNKKRWTVFSFMGIEKSWDKKTQQKFEFEPNATVEQKLHYDIEIRPQFYLKYMVQMNNEVELLGGAQLQVTPLRTSNVPCHIIIDSTSIYKIFVGLYSMIIFRERTAICLWLVT